MNLVNQLKKTQMNLLNESGESAKENTDEHNCNSPCDPVIPSSKSPVKNLKETTNQASNIPHQLRNNDETGDNHPRMCRH